MLIAVLVVAVRLLVNETPSLHCSGNREVNFYLDSMLFCSSKLTLVLAGAQSAAFQLCCENLIQSGESYRQL